MLCKTVINLNISSVTANLCFLLEAFLSASHLFRILFMSVWFYWLLFAVQAYGKQTASLEPKAGAPPPIPPTKRLASTSSPTDPDPVTSIDDVSLTPEQEEEMRLLQLHMTDSSQVWSSILLQKNCFASCCERCKLWYRGEHQLEPTFEWVFLFLYELSRYTFVRI